MDSKNTKTATKPSMYEKVRQLIQVGDAEGLRKLLYGKNDFTKFSLYGGVPRETVTMIALRYEYHAELVKLATTVTARWVNPISLLRMMAITNPQHLCFLDAPENPMSVSAIQEMAGRFSELTDPEVLDFLKNIYFRKDQFLLIPQGFEEDLATWVVKSPFFSDWRQALLCLVQFIPDPFPANATTKSKLRQASKRQRLEKTARRLETQAERRAAKKLTNPRNDRKSHAIGDQEEITYTDPALNPGAVALFEVLNAASAEPTKPMTPMGQEGPVRPPYATDFGDDLSSSCDALLNGCP